MTARTTRAVRIAAGSTAAALVMCTVSLVGTANAADPSDVSSTAAGATGTVTAPEPAVRVDQRVGGLDRYATAAEIANQMVKNGRSVNSLIVASGDVASGGVDALAANYLAGALAKPATETTVDEKTVITQSSPVPVLLTKKDSLPTATAVAISSLLRTRAGNAAVKVYVVGGPSAVSEAALGQIETAAKASGAEVVRVAGVDRYATAADVAATTGAAKVGSYQARFDAVSAKTVFLSNGISTADALSAGPIAYGSHFPVLLTRTDSIPQATLDAMTTNNIKNVILLGDTTVASEAIGKQLDRGGYTVTRLSGPDRYGTNTALYNFATKAKGGTEADTAGGLGYPKAATPLLTNGLGFADALAAGPLAAEGTGIRAVTVKEDTSKDLAANSPLLLTSPKALSTPTQAYITANKATVTKVVGVGLMTALPDSVLAAANDAAE